MIHSMTSVRLLGRSEVRGKSDPIQMPTSARPSSAFNHAARVLLRYTIEKEMEQTSTRKRPAMLGLPDRVPLPD
jgi:hypothetical protein